MIADQDVFILGEQFLGDGRLLIENDFDDDRKQIFLDDMQLEIEEERIAEHNVKIKNELPITIKQEPIAGTSRDFAIAQHFMSSNVEQEIRITQPCDMYSERDDCGYLVEHIDIRSPINSLQPLLETRLGVDLENYEYWLQNAKKLEPTKNLVDQCVQGEGLVQINVEIVSNEFGNRINIVDVLKPTEEFLQSRKVKIEGQAASVPWEVDNNFKNDSELLQIPSDPSLWTKEQVKHWIVWAVRQFNLPGIKLADWNITGRELCDLTLKQFKGKCKNDEGNTFWTHFELLRRCHIFAVVGKEPEKRQVVQTPVIVSSPQKPEKPKDFRMGPKRSRILGCNQSVTERKTGNSVKTGTNGQIQLWQFLLELLTDKNHQNVIHWVSSDGQFKLEDPEKVAQLWGERKHKTAMTYEKLSRALRYYYDGDMIAKVHGKRFVYQFVCDLKELLGYSALQLNNLVVECARKNNLPVSTDFIK